MTMTPTAFHQLSAALTAEPHLDRARVESLLSRLTCVADPAGLTRLAAIVAHLPPNRADQNAVIARDIMTDAALRMIAKTIILLWYTGDLEPESAAAPDPTEDDYFRALLWPTISAHPPALSGGYFGHWSYPPDN